MRKLFFIFCAVVFASLLTGCLSATRATVTEYDAEGRIQRVTETTESIVTSLTKSTANKTVVAWESGWAAYISAATATFDEPTPTVRLFAGKTDKGLVSALPEQENWDGIARAIAATKYELTITSDGLSNGSSNADQ